MTALSCCPLCRSQLIPRCWHVGSFIDKPFFFHLYLFTHGKAAVLFMPSLYPHRSPCIMQVDSLNHGWQVLATHSAELIYNSRSGDWSTDMVACLFFRQTAKSNRYRLLASLLISHVLYIVQNDHANISEIIVPQTLTKISNTTILNILS